MWIQLSQTKYAQSSNTAMQVVDVVETEAELATLRTDLVSAQTLYDARVALAGTQSDPIIKELVIVSYQELYARVLEVEHKVLEKEALLAEIYGNNV